MSHAQNDLTANFKDDEGTLSNENRSVWLSAVWESAAKNRNLSIFWLISAGSTNIQESSSYIEFTTNLSPVHGLYYSVLDAHYASRSRKISAAYYQHCDFQQTVWLLAQCAQSAAHLTVAVKTAMTLLLRSRLKSLNLALTIIDPIAAQRHVRRLARRVGMTGEAHGSVATAPVDTRLSRKHAKRTWPPSTGDGHPGSATASASSFSASRRGLSIRQADWLAGITDRLDNETREFWQ